MTTREIKQEEVNRLIEDATYLQDEAEALRYVIDNVPYDHNPPEGRSIVEMLLLIDHAQLSYYRPILEQTLSTNRPTHLESFIDFNETFEVDETKKNDIQKILGKISKHRAGVVNAIKNTPLIDWEKVIYRDEQPLMLFDFMLEMIRFERGILKEIADRVMVYNQNKETQRKIERQRSQHDGKFTENS